MKSSLCWRSYLLGLASAAGLVLIAGSLTGRAALAADEPKPMTRSTTPDIKPAPRGPHEGDENVEHVHTDALPEPVLSSIRTLGKDIMVSDALRQKFDGLTIYTLLASTPDGAQRLFVMTASGLVLDQEQERRGVDLVPPDMLKAVKDQYSGLEVIRSGHRVEDSFWLYFMADHKPYMATLDNQGGLVIEEYEEPPAEPELAPAPNPADKGQDRKP